MTPDIPTPERPPIPDAVRAYLSQLGQRGGTKSRRKLTREQAMAMNEAAQRKRRERSQGTA